MSFAIIHPQASFAVQGFGPPPEGHEFGGWGFSLALDYQFARLCYAAKRPAEERLTGLAQSIVKRIWPGRHMTTSHDGIHWLDDTLLLWGITVPGNCACLYLNSDDCQAVQSGRGELYAPRAGDWAQTAISYQPHNVDGHKQAYAMMSLWLTWYNAAVASVLFDRASDPKPEPVRGETGDDRH